MTEQNRDDQTATDSASNQPGTGNRPAASANNQQDAANNQATRTTEQGAGRKDGGQGQAQDAGPDGHPTYVYDPHAAIQAGLVHLADMWKESERTYQAIAAYSDILLRYPGTGAAEAAAEGLLDLANRLEQEGRYNAALGIFRRLEAMV